MGKYQKKLHFKSFEKAREFARTLGLTIEKIWGRSGVYVGESNSYGNRRETGQEYLDIFDL